MAYGPQHGCNYSWGKLVPFDTDPIPLGADHARPCGAAGFLRRAAALRPIEYNVDMRQRNWHKTVRHQRRKGDRSSGRERKLLPVDPTDVP